MVHFCFEITDIWWLHFIDVGTFLKTSACWLLKNVQKNFLAFVFYKIALVFENNLGIENLLKDFEIDPIKPPLLAQVLIKSVLMEVY